MQYIIRRLIERGIIARRADEAYLRSALSDSYDVHGTVRSMPAADTVRDPETHWPFNIYGRHTADGVTTRGERLVMLDGEAAGKTWELLSAAGHSLRVIGPADVPVDLAAEGVAVGDHWQIYRAQEDRAIDYLGKAAIRCVVGYPADPTAVPCYSVNLDVSNEQTRPVGNLGRELRGASRPGGNPANELASRWERRYSIVCAAITPEAADWLAALLERLYRESVRLFDRLFDGDARCEVGMLQFVDELKICTREVTISGTLYHRTTEAVEWVVDEMLAEASPTAVRRVEVRSPSR